MESSAATRSRGDRLRARGDQLGAWAVRFRARGLGEETTILRSSGRYFFERVDGLWRIVSFDVERDDASAAA